jgi:hypothetical protein
MIEVSLSSELTNLFNAYYVGDLEVGNTLYYNFDMSSPITSQTLYGLLVTSITTNSIGVITSIAP